MMSNQLTQQYNDEPKERVRLYLSCQDLVSRDIFSKSDPFVIVSLKNKKTGKFEEIGRTETIQNNHYPKFLTDFVLDYYFEQEQELKFDVYDQDTKHSSTVKDQDFLGSCQMFLGEIVHASGQQLAKQLLYRGRIIRNEKTKMYSRLTAKVELFSKVPQEDLYITFACENLASMDFFSKSDPFLEIYRIQNNQLILIYKSEVIDNTKKPRWKSISITSQKLCGSDSELPLLLRVLDWDKSGKSDLIGEVKTNLNALRNNFSAQLQNPNKKGKNMGIIKVIEFKSATNYSFLDYLKGGLDMSLMVAIDLTASNGHPSSPDSLHYLGNPQGSQYEQAIRTIGSIVSCYDSDQKFPVWGFGAQLPNGTVTHDFALNGNERYPEVFGVYGIELAYIQAIQTVKLFGPTYFRPILAKAISIAEAAHANAHNKLQYFILLILTDGTINDFQESKDLLVLAANRFLPLSVIIVGIGMDGFSQMEALDADRAALTNSKGETAKRDIVQFVSLRAFSKLTMNEKGEVISFSDTRFGELSRETLKEIPQQFMSYVKFHGLKPSRPTVTPNLDAHFRISDSDLQKIGTMMDLGTKPSNIVQFSNGTEPPLPPGWQKAYDNDGTPFYVNHSTKVSQWQHPFLGSYLKSQQPLAPLVPQMPFPSGSGIASTSDQINVPLQSQQQQFQPQQQYKTNMDYSKAGSTINSQSYMPSSYLQPQYTQQSYMTPQYQSNTGSTSYQPSFSSQQQPVGYTTQPMVVPTIQTQIQQPQSQQQQQQQSQRLQQQPHSYT